MTDYDPTDAVSVNRLVDRLDACTARLGGESSERAQAIVYAGFLTDLSEGRLDVGDSEIGEMVDLIAQFCDLVEAQSSNPTPN
ncbi:MAG: hypothetical protein VB138_01970 [Burkholderia sp.]